MAAKIKMRYQIVGDEEAFTDTFEVPEITENASKETIELLCWGHLFKNFICPGDNYHMQWMIEEA